MATSISASAITPVCAPDDLEYFVVVDVLERMRQRENGCRSDGNADDDTQALQPGAAAGGVLQHNDLQSVHPIGQQY